MGYRLIQPPFPFKFAELSEAELKEYYRWFMDVMPGRIQELALIVRQAAEFSDWSPDLTPESLDALGHWFETQVETRPQTEEEIEAKLSNFPYPIDDPNWELTDRTFSLAMDIGMYLSQVFLRNNPSLHWEQPLSGSKRYIDYGQPVLKGIGVVPFNPIHIIVTLAYGLADQNRSGDRLREIYDIWVPMLTSEPSKPKKTKKKRAN